MSQVLGRDRRNGSLAMRALGAVIALVGSAPVASASEGLTCDIDLPTEYFS